MESDANKPDQSVKTNETPVTTEIAETGDAFNDDKLNGQVLRQADAATQTGERQNTDKIPVIIKRQIVAERNLPDGIVQIWKPIVITKERVDLHAKRKIVAL